MSNNKQLPDGKREIFCCCCNDYVVARLTDGIEVYAHRGDLSSLPFWKCDGCGNYVGCHHKTKNRTQPLGFIPSPEIKNARREIHALLDPLWRGGKYKRWQLYKLISEHMGFKYHTANLRTLDECHKVKDFLIALNNEGKFHVS